MNEKLAVIIGSAARTARERLGLTQVEVAALMELSSVVYNRLERGRMLPSVPTLVRLCGVLKVSPELLLGLSPATARRGSRKGTTPAEDPPSVHHLTTLARKMDETERQAFIQMARVVLR